MARDTRTEPEVEATWQDFHQYVNVTSEQLRGWLLTRGSGEETFPADPDLALPEPGRHILAVLRKRKVDLTPNDVDVMRTAIAGIQALLDARPPRGNADDQWRHALLDLGHDPLGER